MAGLSWANVPDDLLFLLAERVLGVATFTRFSAVCKSWHSIASATKCCKPVPWLMLAENEGSELRDFYDHSTGEVYQFPLPQARGMKNVGSAHGWLITAGEDGSFNLLNPSTQTQIALPPATTLQNVSLENIIFSPKEMRDFLTVKATCSPIGPNGDYTVALTHKGNDQYVLSFCGSTDEKWTGFQLLGPNEVGFVGGAFYIVTYLLKIYGCEFSSTPKLIEIADLPQDLHYGFLDTYIVECAGEILVVVKIYDSSEIHDSSGEEISYSANFRVFKLDVEGKKVVEVKSIGDYALFLGMNNSICLPATLDSKHIFKRNCIYFTDDRHEMIDVGEVEMGEDMGVFNLEDGSLTTHYPGVSKSLYSFPIWVTFIQPPAGIHELTKIRG